MSFLKLIPLSQLSNLEELENCPNLHEFLERVINLTLKTLDLREQQALLSIYMAFRDHYPSYLKDIPADVKNKLDDLVRTSDPKIIKLRRIVLSELSKVA